MSELRTAIANDIAAVDEMTTDERQLALGRVQDRLQELWDRIAWREGDIGTGTAKQADATGRHLERLWERYAELEAEERRLLVPGFPIRTPARARTRNGSQ